MFFPQDRTKLYVEVRAVHREDGEVKPLSIRLPDGRTYRVKEVIGRPAVDDLSSTRRRVMRYTVRIAAKRTWLYCEIEMDRATPSERWFVASKQGDGVCPFDVQAHYAAISQQV